MRPKCYNCFRPTSSCICNVAEKINTKSQFLILMHPMERQKVKNNTGFITHYSLPNSKLIEGIDFSKHPYVNEVLTSSKYNSYILYPSKGAKTLNDYSDEMQINLAEKRTNVFIIIDSTWPCAKKILNLSPNLKKARHITFDQQYVSGYKIKEQPKDGFISTIETVQVMLSDLTKNKIEKIDAKNIENFINPFIKINEYQLECINDPTRETYSSRLNRNKA